VPGVGKKEQGLFLALALILLAPFPAISARSIFNENKLSASVTIGDLSPSQYDDSEPIIIQNEADFISYGFSGNGTLSSPYLIEGLNISTRGETCITIADVNVSFTIRNCFFRNDRASYPVLWLLNVFYSTIEYCVTIGGSEGILGSLTRNLTILGNTICDGTHGLRFINSINVTVEENSIYSNSRGVELVHSSHCLFSNNRIYGNSLRGLNVDESSTNNSILSNLIGWNEITAIYSHNAQDDGGNNTWSGNSWSDYVAPEPYNITGEAQSQDLLPTRLIDVEAPIINAPADIIMGEGSQVNVSWYPIDAFPSQYWVRMNAIVISQGAWVNDEFTLSLQDLEPGDYDLFLSVADASGNITEDYVFVSVLFVILGDIGTELVAYASALSVALFLLVICLFKKRS
jgi:parallel beta-helix repeat protein